MHPLLFLPTIAPPARVGTLLSVALLLLASMAAPAAAQLTQAEKDEILDAHNLVHSDVARGLVGSQPSATNMAKLVWDERLGQVAQAWAENCDLAPNPDRTTEYQALGGTAFYVGENAYATSLVSDTPADAVAAWFSEEASYTYPTFSLSVGHYTQLVWADTRLVGCAVATCPFLLVFSTDRLLICDYAPGGNVNPYVQPPYESGPTASNCPVDLPGVENGLCVAAAAVSALPEAVLWLLIVAITAIGGCTIASRS